MKALLTVLFLIASVQLSHAGNICPDGFYLQDNVCVAAPVILGGSERKNRCHYSDVPSEVTPIGEGEVSEGPLSPVDNSCN